MIIVGTPPPRACPRVPPRIYPRGSTRVGLCVIPSSVVRTTTEVPRNVLSESHGLIKRTTSFCQPPNPHWYVKRRPSDIRLRMKISVITDISILRFYGYIGYIGDIWANILEKNIDKPKIDQNLEKKYIRKTS